MGSWTLKPTNAMRALRKTVYFSGFIPPKRKCSARTYLVYNILWFTSTLMLGLKWIVLTTAMKNHINEMLTITQLAPQFVVNTIIGIRTFIWRRYWTTLQNMNEDWDNFIANQTPAEEVIMQKYNSKVGPILTLVFIACPVTISIRGLMPVVLPMLLPLDGEYPFETPRGSPLWAVAYVFDSIVMIHCANAAIMDLSLMVRLWSTTARFEMLYADFETVKCLDDVRRCMQQQRYLKGLIEDQKRILTWMGVTISLVVLFGVSAGGFVLLNGAKIEDLVFLILLMCINITQLFMYCWAGDSLIEQSQGLTKACFKADWTDVSPQIKRCLLIMVEGSRRPIVICLPGLLPVMSLEYFATSMTAVVSYITTLLALAQ